MVVESYRRDLRVVRRSTWHQFQGGTPGKGQTDIYWRKVYSFFNPIHYEEMKSGRHAQIALSKMMDRQTTNPHICTRDMLVPPDGKEVAECVNRIQKRTVQDLYSTV
jgi:hypothetical protein